MSGLKERFRGRPKEEWRGVALEKRQTYLENHLVVLHPENVKPLREIRRLYRRCRVTGNGRAVRIVGGSGSGKTHFLKLLETLLPNTETEEATLVQMVRFSVPDNPTPERLTRTMLLALGDPAWNLKRDGMDRAWHLIREAGVLLIAIDDVQDIPEHRGQIGLRIATNWIRTLIENSGCLILLVGTQASERVVLSNPQTRRRDATKFLLNYFKIAPEHEAARFKRYLKEVDDLLPLAELCGLEKFAKPLYWASYGIADYIFKIVEEAIEFAVSEGREQLVREDFAKGFEKHFQDAAPNLNPFLKDGPERLLNGADEPFENWDQNATVERTEEKPKRK
jgi:hypothetical protein